MGRRSTSDQAAVDETIPEKSDIVILSVRLKSGRFNAELQVPLFGSADIKDSAVEQWVDFIQTGFRIGATSMDATLKPEGTGK